MSEYVGVWQMNNTFENLQVEQGTFHQYTSSEDGRTNRESEKYVEIIEEPLTDGYRFRYENEGRKAGPIKGVKSKDGHTTHPTIKIHGHRGPAYIIVSLITIHGLYPHPHKLVGEDCKDGIFRKLIDVAEMPYCFSDLRIQCVKKKKKEVEESLKERERRRIDPFGTGFSHSSDLNKINFNAVRLCFQVLLPDSNGNFEYPVPLNPAISKPIYDSKSASKMSIMKLSHCSASVEGEKEIILLCGQVDKDDIEIIFYEEKDKEIIWTGYGDFFPHDVHYKVAISFRTPAYKTLNVHKPIYCFIYLRRKSDGTIGRPRPFTLLPIEKDSEGISSKRRKFHSSSTRKDKESKNFCSPKPVHCTPRTVETTVRKDAMHNNVHCTPKTVETTFRKGAMHKNGTVNEFNVRCNPEGTFYPLPSTSVRGNDSYVQKGPLVCYNPEKHTSSMSQDQFVGAPSLGLPPNTQQVVDHVDPVDFQNIQPNKAIAFGDPRQNNKLEMLSKDVDPKQNYSNENISSISLDSDDIVNGFDTIFGFIFGVKSDEQMTHENIVGLFPNSDAEDSTDDEQMPFQNNARVLQNSDAEDSTNGEQMSFQNNVEVLQNSDSEDSADDCLDRLSSLSLEPNSKDPDVTMRDVANHSFSEAVGISILVSS